MNNTNSSICPAGMDADLHWVHQPSGHPAGQLHKIIDTYLQHIPDDYYIETYALDHQNDRCHSAYYKLAKLKSEAVWRQIAAWDTAGYDCYMGVQPRWKRRKGLNGWTHSNETCIWYCPFLFLDIDYGGDQYERWRSQHSIPKETILIETRPDRRHALFLLDGECPNRDYWRALQGHFLKWECQTVQWLRPDYQCADPVRGFRIPGTHNHKAGGAEVRLLHIDSNISYLPQNIVRANEDRYASWETLRKRDLVIPVWNGNKRIAAAAHRALPRLLVAGLGVKEVSDQGESSDVDDLLRHLKERVSFSLLKDSLLSDITSEQKGAIRYSKSAVNHDDLRQHLLAAVSLDGRESRHQACRELAFRLRARLGVFDEVFITGFVQQWMDDNSQFINPKTTVRETVGSIRRWWKYLDKRFPLGRGTVAGFLYLPERVRHPGTFLIGGPRYELHREIADLFFGIRKRDGAMFFCGEVDLATHFSSSQQCVSDAIRVLIKKGLLDRPVASDPFERIAASYDIPACWLSANPPCHRQDVRTGRYETSPNEQRYFRIMKRKREEAAQRANVREDKKVAG